MPARSAVISAYALPAPGLTSAWSPAGAHLEAIRAAGLRLQYDGKSMSRTFAAPITRPSSVEQDYVIIGLKAHTIDEAVDAMQPLLGPSTCIVTASNGIPYWYFHGDERLSGVHFQSIDPGGRQWDRLGPERAIGCVVLPAAEVIAPGSYATSTDASFRSANPAASKAPRVQLLHEAMVAGGLEAPIREDIRDEIWLKLCGNLCFNPISALTLATIDVIAGDAGTRAICRAMMLEAKAIGDFLGSTPSSRYRAAHRRRGALGAHKMSMLQDLERGRSMEIEPLVGVVQELGLNTGVPTPTTDVVLALIRQRARRATGTLH